MEGFDAIKIYWMDNSSIVWEGMGPANYTPILVCFEIIPLSDVDGEEGLHKIMERYWPRYSKNKILVKPFKIEFVYNNGDKNER